MNAADRDVIDVVIPVHDTARPVDRAARSVLDRPPSDARLRVTIVCHNVSATRIAARLSAETRRGASLLELSDGVPSPSGPMEFGRAATNGEFLSFLGSDDLLEAGALEAWLHRARRDRLGAVIAPERMLSGSRIRTPPVRPILRRALDPVRDRLAYRSAPLGLLRRSAIDRAGSRFTPRLPSGEDQEFSLRLWFSGERIGYARGAPAYVVGDDGPPRVTGTNREIGVELSAVTRLLSDPWFTGRAQAERRAIAVKCVRVHVFGAVLSRSVATSWTSADAEVVRALLARLEDVAPTYSKAFSIADGRLRDLLAVGEARAGELARSSRDRREFWHPRTWLTKDPRGQFSAEGPVRFMVASALL